MRIIAGEAYGAKAAVAAYSPLFYVHAHLQAGASLALPHGYSERAAYVVTGAAEIGNDRLSAGEMAVFRTSAAGRIKALETAHIMLLGGEPVGPRFIDWNFVSSSKERIEQAKADWRAGRMKLPDLDHDEFIPLPDPAAPANPMS